MDKSKNRSGDYSFSISQKELINGILEEHSIRPEVVVELVKDAVEFKEMKISTLNPESTEKIVEDSKIIQANHLCFLLS